MTVKLDTMPWDDDAEFRAFVREDAEMRVRVREHVETDEELTRVMGPAEIECLRAVMHAMGTRK